MNDYEKEELSREETAPDQAVPGPEAAPEPEVISEPGMAQAAPEPESTPEPELTQAVPAASASGTASETGPENAAPGTLAETAPEAPQPNILEELKRIAEERAAQQAEGPKAPPSREPGSFQDGGYPPPPPPPQGRQSWQGGRYQQQYQPYPPSPPYGGPGWPTYGPNTTGWQQTPWQQPYSTGPGGKSPQQAAGYRPQETSRRERTGGPEDLDELDEMIEIDEAMDAAPVKKKKKRRGLRLLLRLTAALLVLAMVAGTGYAVYAIATGENPLSGHLVPSDEVVGGSSQGGNPVPDVVINDRPSREDRYDGTEEGALTNNAIFKKVSPSVVGIVARMGDSFYGDSSQGSGIIMSEDGYIITNAHVVEGATSYEVVLTGGESHQAQLVGADRNSDLAVLKVDETGLSAAEFGNSDQAEVGDRVCVIGNPGGLRFQNSLTVGYISALKRTINTGGYSIDCLQTDAAVNPGNSGGPLINAYGQVIGITSAKIALTDYEGICFAIPITDAMPIIRQLISDGKVTGRAMLGITAKAVQASEAEFYEIPLGLWVVTVTPGADIGAKGIREGDIITHIDDTPIYSLDACSNVLKNHSPGDTVTITVFRRESSMTDTTFKADIVLQGS